ncbi:MAG: sodium:calcium antiporter [Flavobacteriales bacterium]|nr:sodium:calcium antiporter [Flavobacteriales bacterium]MCB9167690.1 sodium:calcium antiporter [Flavobacteriales bacterium]
MSLLITLVGLVVLVVGAELLLRGAVNVAFRANLSPLVVGLTVVSVGTSAPELVVSLSAAFHGSPSIAVGNVIGSNIANIALILGLCVLVFPMEPDRDAYRIHWPVMMVASLLVLALLQNDRLGRGEGLVLVLMLLAYVVWMVRRSRREHLRGPVNMVSGPIWRDAVFLFIGIAGLTKGGEWFVSGASDLSRQLGISEQLIGLTVVALGTSMPELAASLVAAFRKQPDIGLGNIIGSNVFNLLGILGTTSLVRPLQADHLAFFPDLMVMLATGLVLYPLARFFRRIGRWQGAVLLTAYFGYVYYLVNRG